MGKPPFQPGPVFGVKRVHAVNDEYPVLKVRYQPPTQQGINVGIDSRQTMEEVHTMDALWSGIRIRRGLWFVFGSKRGAGGNRKLVVRSHSPPPENRFESYFFDCPTAPKGGATIDETLGQFCLWDSFVFANCPTENRWYIWQWDNWDGWDSVLRYGLIALIVPPPHFREA
jgi:hypothetical protein